MKSFETILVEQCAPTLAGIKVANLFRCIPPCSNIRGLMKFWNQRLGEKGLALLCLKQCANTGACLFYVYRKTWMERLLAQENIRAFLWKQGYRLSDCAKGYISQLAERLCLQEGFPHEIGIFLGYPMEDVIGFIENKGKNYSLCGYWKVYGDAEVSRRRFNCYRNCTDYYKKKHQNGASVMQLISAVS